MEVSRSDESRLGKGRAKVSHTVSKQNISVCYILPLIYIQSPTSTFTSCVLLQLQVSILVLKQNTERRPFYSSLIANIAALWGKRALIAFLCSLLFTTTILRAAMMSSYWVPTACWLGMTKRHYKETPFWTNASVPQGSVFQTGLSSRTWNQVSCGNWHFKK